MNLSVVVPLFNEETTIEFLLNKVLSQKSVIQVIVVDDASTDNSVEKLKFIGDERVLILKHEKNLGKGAAIRTAQSFVNGDIVIIQDADLEYNPDEYPKLINPILRGKADVVFGSRFQSGESRRVLYFWHYLGNRILTFFSNMMTDLNLSDMETCYKAIRSELFKRILIQESRFGFEPEITGKLAAHGARFYEVSISYDGRTYEQGKKIRPKDGIRALWCVIKFNKFRMIRRLTRRGQI